MSAYHRWNWPALAIMLNMATQITFNGNKYDRVMISAAATGRFDNDMLKRLSDYMFANRFTQPWEVAQEWGFELLNFDHIDLIEVAPGDGGLKQYGGRLHTRKMQDLPYDPARILTYEEMLEVAKYCGNDLEVTDELYGALEEDIQTRIELNEQYGIDVRSKSDAQIAETVFKKLLGLDYKAAKALNLRAQKPAGFTWKYMPPAFLRFQTPEMINAFQRVLATTFSLTDKHQISAPLLEKYEFGFGGAVYRMGVGGLHSSESCTVHRAGPDCVLVDIDATSYYPWIIRLLKLFPAHIGPHWLDMYNSFIDTRVKYKSEGKKRKANTYKILLNGSFGKTKERHSILFDPVMFSQIVITGQLSLLMLIERQHLAGVQAVQANTDGVVFKCHPNLVPTRKAVVAQFEADTGFVMEDTDYIALMSRDVNSYMAFKPAYTDNKGVHHPIEVKTKGEYADDPQSRLSKNPANQICLDAIKAFVIYGTPVEQTIRTCTDIRKFVTVRNVAGGGSWVRETIQEDNVTQKRAALAQWGWTAADAKGRNWIPPLGAASEALTTEEAVKTLKATMDREPIGKTVRWYYGAGQRGHIATPKGGMVAKSQGAKPCMDLPDTLPPDIDYNWYVTETISMLQDLGVLT